MSHLATTVPNMGFRETLQNGYGTARNKATTAVDNVRSRGGRTAQAVDFGLKGVSGAVKTVSKVSSAAIDRSTRFIGLDRYRIELEAALDEAMRVIATQEARIARLEHELGGRDR